MDQHSVSMDTTATLDRSAPMAAGSGRGQQANGQTQEQASGSGLRLAGDQALSLLESLPEWGPVVTIVLHGGCVFEFKGEFPSGSVGRGFYNLDGPVPGFHGHLNLSAIDHIGFQDRPHAGRRSLALTFNDRDGGSLFKVFVGRSSDGELISQQVQRFESLRKQAQEIEQEQKQNELHPLTGATTNVEVSS